MVVVFLLQLHLL
jgi:hypothetical protein